MEDIRSARKRMTLTVGASIDNGFRLGYLVSIQKWLFFTISASDSNFNAQNTQYIPALKILVFLDVAKNLSFLDGHCLKKVP
jgi:hypothetical protein